MDNLCVVCGEIIPEGRMVCPRHEYQNPMDYDYILKAIKRIERSDKDGDQDGRSGSESRLEKS